MPSVLSVLKPQSGGAADFGEHWRRDQPGRPPRIGPFCPLGGTRDSPPPCPPLSVASPKGPAARIEPDAASAAVTHQKRDTPAPSPTLVARQSPRRLRLIRCRRTAKAASKAPAQLSTPIAIWTRKQKHHGRCLKVAVPFTLTFLHFFCHNFFFCLVLSCFPLPNKEHLHTQRRGPCFGDLFLLLFFCPITIPATKEPGPGHRRSDRHGKQEARRPWRRRRLSSTASGP